MNVTFINEDTLSFLGQVSLLPEWHSSAYVPLRTEPDSVTVEGDRAIISDRDLGSPSFRICNDAGCPRSLSP